MISFVGGMDEVGTGDGVVVGDLVHCEDALAAWVLVGDVVLLIVLDRFAIKSATVYSKLIVFSNQNIGVIFALTITWIDQFRSAVIVLLAC